MFDFGFRCELSMMDTKKDKIKMYIDKYFDYILSKKVHLITSDFSNEKDIDIQHLVTKIVKYFADNITNVHKLPTKDSRRKYNSGYSTKLLRDQSRVNYNEVE